MSDSKVTFSCPCGFLGLLQIAFIVLKLCKVIDWSWIWVLSPIILNVVLFIVLLVGTVFLAAWSDRRRW